MKKENDLLEETLSIAENGYAAAYQFLRMTGMPVFCGESPLRRSYQRTL